MATHHSVPSAAVLGLEVRRVRVEVSITRGTPLIQIVGLAESAVREGRERIRAAAAQLGLHVPGLRITVNLAPAGIRKHGAAFDLPIVVGILAAAGQVPGERAGRTAMVGELGLDGSLRSVPGCLPIALHAAQRADVESLLVPRANLRETGPATRAAGETGGRLDVRGAASLNEVLAFLRGERWLPTPEDLPPRPPASASNGGDLATVRGQEGAKRALEIAAAGGHNLLFKGPPGAGKTTLARCLPSILPPLELAEAVEVTAIHSVAGRLPEDAGLLTERPFRAPHHTISDAGLIGGGPVPRPGEVSLAHRGVLFLDELPEFSRRALEVLRQPLEEGAVRVVRARATARFPSRFMLAAAMNRCPCGHQGDGTERCACDPRAVERYRGRVSGPLLDRVDLQVEVPPVGWDELVARNGGEPSARVAARVREARARAARRLGGRTNAEMTTAEVEGEADRLGTGAEELLRSTVDHFALSARTYHRILKVARTAADLAGRERIEADAVGQAVALRVLGE